MIKKNTAINASPELTAEIRPDAIYHHKTVFQKLRRYSGIGFLIAVGYMDPGNWATDIEAGSRFGYALLFVVLGASLIAMLLQTLCIRVGVATKMDLAQLCRAHFNRKTNFILWVLAEIAIIACDFAEVLGTALALKLLFGLPLEYGVLLTAFDTLIILGLQGRKFIKIKTIIIFLVTVITACFAYEIYLSKPDFGLVMQGFIPNMEIFKESQAWLLAIGILGATVMPHNLYLHSSAVQRREIGKTEEAKTKAIKLMTLDILVTLSIAFLVNAAILVLAATSFHFAGFTEVKEIDEAHNLLAPILGTSIASVVFAVALFASGQSSTFTGTIAGQVIFEGFLNLKIARWVQRLITRCLSVVPAWVAISIMGEGAIGQLLVLSQVILSMQLPFAIIPLILFSRSKRIMGERRISLPLFILCLAISLGIISANIYLIMRFL